MLSLLQLPALVAASGRHRVLLLLTGRSPTVGGLTKVSTHSPTITNVTGIPNEPPDAWPACPVVWGGPGETPAPTRCPKNHAAQRR